MRRHLLDLALLFAFCSLVAVYVALAQPSIRVVTLHIYVLVVGGLLMLGIVAAAGEAIPRREESPFDRALGVTGSRPSAPPELARLERQVSLGVASAYDLHVRLLPQLREIAEARLERTGRRSSPETLGRWWDLLRPDRPPPSDRAARGISESDLRALVTDLAKM